MFTQKLLHLILYDKEYTARNEYTNTTRKAHDHALLDRVYNRDYRLEFEVDPEMK